MYKKILLGTGVLTIALIVLACVFSSRADVVIFSTAEDYRLDQLANDLKQKFPDKSIAIQYMSTGELRSKLENEDINTSCDIVFGLEATNADLLLKSKPGILYDMVNDFVGEWAPSNIYDEEVLSTIPEEYYKEGVTCKYHLFDKEAGCIMVNTKMLQEKSLPIPESFDDLIKPIYEGLICMPDPVKSGTGYYWLNGFVSCWGLEATHDYMAKLDKNMMPNGYTPSGSGPLKNLKKGDAAIALGMSFQAAKEIYDDPTLPIKMLYFDIKDADGTIYQKASPYTLYTMGVVNTKWNKEGVREVYRYLYEEWIYKDKYMFDPEVIYKKQSTKEFTDLVQTYFGDYSFPTSYMPMKEIFNGKYKQDLLETWETWRNKNYGD